MKGFTFDQNGKIAVIVSITTLFGYFSPIIPDIYKNLFLLSGLVIAVVIIVVREIKVMATRHPVAGPNAVVSIAHIAELLRIEPDKSITNTAHRLQTRLPGIQGLILLWADSECRGLASDAIIINKNWEPRRIPECGSPPPAILDPLDHNLLSSINPIIDTNLIFQIKEEHNNPKVWIKEMKYPFRDEPFLGLTLGGMDYRQTIAIECAFTQPIEWKGRKITLREVYESRELDILEFLPSMVVVHVIMKTVDNYLVLTQRSKSPYYAPHQFSP